MGKICNGFGGAWSIGFVYGKDPFSLNAPTGLANDTFPCLRNPILTCMDVTDVDAAYVADPWLFMSDGQHGKWSVHHFF